jgi:hypothetical protein
MRNTLEDHLSALRQAGRISTWHDLELEAGTEWEPAILNKLDTADIILLLVSSSFIASRYCYGTELKRAIARHDAGTARVIPIILRPCDWNHSYVPFSKLNVLPDHAKAIKSWADPDEAFTIVAQRIRETVNQLKTKKLAERQTEEQKIAQKEAEQQAEQKRTQREQRLQVEEQERQMLAQREAEQQAKRERLIQQITRKDLQECNPTKILFIKNVKDPFGWAYSLDRMQQIESRAFELMWRSGSHGASLPKTGDLIILHQQAKVTHVVEFLDAQVRKTDTGSFRWVRAVWIAEQDWSQLPHQKDILGFSPNYSDGNTHSLRSLGFSTFRKAWSSLEEFQKHIFNRLTQSEAIVTNEDDLASEKGVDYTRLRDLLKAGQWKEGDQETADRMLEALDRQGGLLLGSEDIRDFPLTDLRTIDQLWTKYSNGKFGFSIQRHVLDHTFCNSKVTPETCLSEYEMLNSIEDSSDRLTERWRIFGENLGWYERGQWIMEIDYTQEIANKPEGYLPLLGQPPKVRPIQANRCMMMWWWALLLRLQPWNCEKL